MAMLGHSNRDGSRWVRRIGFGNVVGVAAALAVLPATLIGPANPATASAIGPESGTAAPMTLTQKLDDRYKIGQSGPTASVTVSQTADLARQRITVSWKGLSPTVNGTDYPVVIMQCWGKPSEVKPQNCWTNSRDMDKATVADATDFRNTTGDAAPEPSYDTDTSYGPNDLWGDFSPAQQATSGQGGELPFVARDGGWYLWGSSGNPAHWPSRKVKRESPPGQSEDTTNYQVRPGASPLNYALTAADGTGSTPFEVLDAFNVPSLGCTSSNACSLVVIPVGDPNCRPTAEYPKGVNTRNLEKMCTGASNGMKLDTAWKSPTNWGRRFAFPLTFRPAPELCNLDNRKETGLVGSMLMAPAMASWRPKFCTDAELFKLGYTAQVDGLARRQFLDNSAAKRADGVNAVLTSQKFGEDPGRPVAYAPVAVTGFALAYVVDDGVSTKEVTNLRFNPRLLAKLITQSYPTSLGVNFHAPTEKNPKWWGEDPEFRELNPDFHPADPREGCDFPLLVQGDVDVVHALSEYLAADPDARQFLEGVPDKWGMVVNPAFRGTQTPFEQFELKDGWALPEKVSGFPAGAQWFNQASNQVASLDAAALSVMQAWPTAQTNYDTQNQVFKRTVRQTYGTRALLGVVSLPDAMKYQLNTAALRNNTGNFVSPTTASMEFALKAAKVDEKTGVFTLNQEALGNLAYPGTMGVYAGLPTASLNTEQANNYATFVTYAAGKGQEYGPASGQLPAGYLPLTAPLRTYARQVADAVRAQKGEVPTPPTTVENPGGGGAGGPGGSVPGGGVRPTPSGSTGPDGGKTPVNAAATSTDTSGVARWALPLLLGVGLLAGILAPVALVVTRPEHPVHRFARGLLQRLRRFVRPAG